jgi:hypothetical protein
VNAGNADASLKAAVQQWHRLRWITVGVLAALFTLGLLAAAAVLIAQQHRLSIDDQRLTASCQFYGSLAGFPLTQVPGTSKPSKLGVGILAGGRVAFTGQDCPGTLPPPSPLLVKWAAIYHDPLR